MSDTRDHQEGTAQEIKHCEDCESLMYYRVEDMRWYCGSCKAYQSEETHSNPDIPTSTAAKEIIQRIKSVKYGSVIDPVMVFNVKMRIFAGQYTQEDAQKLYECLDDKTQEVVKTHDINENQEKHAVFTRYLNIGNALMDWKGTLTALYPYCGSDDCC